MRGASENLANVKKARVDEDPLKTSEYRWAPKLSSISSQEESVCETPTKIRITLNLVSPRGQSADFDELQTVTSFEGFSAFTPKKTLQHISNRYSMAETNWTKSPQSTDYVGSNYEEQHSFKMST